MKPSKGKKIMAILIGISIAALIVMHMLEGDLLIIGLNH
jgi:hypothetical protein